MKLNEQKPKSKLALYFLTFVLLCGQWRICDGADKELWVYCPANFLVDSECERVYETMERAAKAGYTHCLVNDSKFSRLGEMYSNYFDHLEELKSKAASLNLTLVPACCPVGYSNDILALNPNLAEGLPVRRSLYRVNGDQAVHVPDPNVSLPPLADRKQWGFIDDVFVAAQDWLVADAPFGAHARIMKSIKPQKFQQYHASVWIKTENFTPQVEIKVLDLQSHDLSYTYLNVKPTQDWTQHHITFNSLDNDELNFYIGVWGPKTGKLWLRDAQLESTGAVNMVRRSTAPIRVQRIDGGNSVDLKENVDFETWTDSKLGQVPYSGEYEAWHEPPPIRLKRKLPPGTELEVSYFHTHVIHESQVCGSIGDAEFEELLNQHIASLGKTIPADSYMMAHDEYRVMGWTDHSIAGLPNTASPGDLLTHNAKVCFQAILQSNPHARALIWSDMFDPHHNAIANYYLVNGSLESSTLPKEVVVMNWNSGKRRESLQHFQRLGHHQIIAGYYDESPEQIRDWLDVVMDNQIPNVDGVMYTTWVKDYGDLEAFASSVRSHRWYK